MTGAEAQAAEVVRLLLADAVTVATAESLTGGLVCATLTDAPGASGTVRGAVVAYATEIKAAVLGVDAGLLQREGAVDREVAAQMAQGVRRLLHTDVGVSTTGVAGPDPADGKPVGTVFVAVSGPVATVVEEHAFPGDRDQVRRAAVGAALDLLTRTVPNLRPGREAAGYGGPTSSTPTSREEAP